MSRIEFYAPPNVDPSEALIMPGVLRGTIETIDGRMGDLGQRARWIADSRGMGAVMVQRVTEDDVSRQPRTFLLGLPQAYEPSEYTRRVSHDAQIIARLIAERGLSNGRVGAFLASAAGGYGLDLARAGLPITNFAIYDTNMVKDYGKNRFTGAVRALLSWGDHQLSEELGRPDRARNQNPLPYPVKAAVSPIQDIALHAKIWQSTRAADNLVRLATGELCSGAATRYTQPGRTFTLGPVEGSDWVDLLNRIAEESGTDFQARWEPGLYHSATDDPAFCEKRLEGAMPVLKRS